MLLLFFIVLQQSTPLYFLSWFFSPSLGTHGLPNHMLFPKKTAFISLLCTFTLSISYLGMTHPFTSQYFQLSKSDFSSLFKLIKYYNLGLGFVQCCGKCSAQGITRPNFQCFLSKKYTLLLNRCASPLDLKLPELSIEGFAQDRF